MRIVAQITGEPEAPPSGVRFFVDNVLLGEAREGPPWAVEWADDNPFEPREIAAEAWDALGRTARDVVFLKPYEVVERAEVSSVLIDASVQDRFGRFVTGIPAVQVHGIRERRSAGARCRQHRKAAGHLHAAHR